LAKVDRSALLDEAKAMGLTELEASDALDRLVADVREGIEHLPIALTDGWASEPILDLISRRADRLAEGAPLGAPNGRPPLGPG
jgi:hypothetical protein